jgi:hypothetical protein
MRHSRAEAEETIETCVEAARLAENSPEHAGLPQDHRHDPPAILGKRSNRILFDKPSYSGAVAFLVQNVNDNHTAERYDCDDECCQFENNAHDHLETIQWITHENSEGGSRHLQRT